MSEYSADSPLLPTDEINLDFRKKKVSIFKSIAKWVLKVLMWVVFIAWISLIFTYPSEFMTNLVNQEWINAMEGSIFGMTGSFFLVYTAPVLIIAILAMLYVVITEKDEIQEKKTRKRRTFGLWTYPIMMDGAFGVVTAAEFIGMFFVVAFVIWACAVYTVFQVEPIF